MLNAMQIQMLQQAADANASHIHSIAAVAALMGDVDTVQYIQQNYLHLFTAQQAAALQTTLQQLLCEELATATMQ